MVQKFFQGGRDTLNIQKLKKSQKLQSRLLASLLTALLFCLPYERIPSFPITVGGISVDLRLSFIVGGVLIVAVGIILVWQRQLRSQLKHPLYYALATFLFVYFLSLLVSSDVKRALSVWVFTAFTIAVGVAVSLAWKYRQEAWLSRALYITTWIVVAFGFYQYFGDMLGLSTSWTGLRDIYTKVVFGVPRIQSTGLEPLYYANFLLIPFFFYAAKFLRSEEERPVLLIAIVTQLVLSVSRGAMYAGIIGLILLFLLTIRQLKPLQVTGFLAMIILGVALALGASSLPGLSKTQLGQQKSTTVVVVEQASNLDAQDDRVRNRVFAWQAFTEHPVLGIGPGNFSQYAKQRYDGYTPMEGYLIVNNEPLEILAEGGLLSFLSLAFFVIWLMINLIYKAWTEKTHSPVWSIAIACYLVALAIQYQAFSTLYIVHVWVALGIALGIVALPQNGSSKKNT